MSELWTVERLYGAQTVLAVSSVTAGVLGKVGIIYFEFCVHGTVHLSNTSDINTKEMQLFILFIRF
jgi:hypothetical protein